MSDTPHPGLQHPTVVPANCGESDDDAAETDGARPPHPR